MQHLPLTLPLPEMCPLQKQSDPLQSCFFLKVHFLFSYINPLNHTLFDSYFHIPVSHSVPCLSLCLSSQTSRTYSPFSLTSFMVASWCLTLRQPSSRCIITLSFAITPLPGLFPACTEMLLSCWTPYAADRNRKWLSLGRWRKWDTSCSWVQSAERSRMMRWSFCLNLSDLTLPQRFCFITSNSHLVCLYVSKTSQITFHGKA